jgi:hypothetical protein
MTGSDPSNVGASSKLRASPGCPSRLRRADAHHEARDCCLEPSRCDSPGEPASEAKCQCCRLNLANFQAEAPARPGPGPGPGGPGAGSLPARAAGSRSPGR